MSQRVQPSSGRVDRRRALRLSPPARKKHSGAANSPGGGGSWTGSPDQDLDGRRHENHTEIINLKGIPETPYRNQGMF